MVSDQSECVQRAIIAQNGVQFSQSMMLFAKEGLLESPRLDGWIQTPLVARRPRLRPKTPVDHNVQEIGTIHGKDNIEKRAAKARERTWLPRGLIESKWGIGRRQEHNGRVIGRRSRKPCA